MSLVSKQMKSFVKDEQGNVTIFSVFMLVLILIITGASVDIMRFEATRAKMQSTMDRAVLAAADLDQEQDPTFVVHDYMSKVGLEDVLTSVHVDQGMNYRVVEANGRVDLDTIFLHMSGFDSLAIPASSMAEEKISNVEISVVLDVSGSMGGSRITNMRNAAKEFVDTVIQVDGDGTGLTTVSIVPYNATVNLGETNSQYWTLSDLHTYSSCPIFDAQDFDETAINPGDAMERLAHFDLYSTSEWSSEIASPWCHTGDTSAVMVHSADGTELKQRIGELQADGNTAIDLGVKWGVALLDPAARPVLNAMASDARIPTEAAARPAEYDDPEAIKFVVVMTDGENTTEYDLRPQYKYGMSDVWVDDRGNSNPDDDRFSVLVRDYSGSSNDVYFWQRYENNSYSRYKNYVDGNSNARRLTNPELYARFGVRAVAMKFYERPYYDRYISYNDFYDRYYGYTGIVDGNQADERLSDICRAARDKGIVIFAIAFEAPWGGQQALQDCASSASHYFDVQGVEITETFHAIARQINSLRLVQ